MPLDDPEWTLVGRLVVDHLVGTDNPYAVLRMYFPNDVDHWRVTQVASENAATIVYKARSSGLYDANPLPIRLLEVLSSLNAIQVLPDIHKVTDYLNRLRAEKAALDRDDPYGVRVLAASGQVFIDRHSVRESLRRLVSPAPGRPEPIVLRVEGQRNTGMSYTYSLIQHLAAPCGFSLARVILTGTSTAEDILRDLAVRVAPRARADAVGDPTKRLRYWALWLVEEARLSSDGRPWWFVLDQCDDLDPGSDSVEFICQLALVIAEMTPGPNERRPRLVLLGYGDALPDLPLPYKQIHPDHVQRVGEADLQTFFGQSFRHVDEQRRGWGATDETRLDQLVTVAVQRVLREAENAERAGGCYMRALSRAAEEALDVYAT